MSVLRQSLADAAAAMPDDAGRLAALAARSAALIAAMGSGSATGIHRDWHPDQALIDGERVWIVDFDLHAEGDPALDLGNFVAHVTELAIRRHEVCC